jgi:hypothetical protein
MESVFETYGNEASGERGNERGERKQYGGQGHSAVFLSVDFAEEYIGEHFSGKMKSRLSADNIDYSFYEVINHRKDQFWQSRHITTMHLGSVSEATNVLESACRLGAAERVRDFVISRSEGVLIAEPDDEDVRLYREFEGSKMAEMEDRLDALLGNTVIPMAVGYVRHRFPERKNEEFPRIDNVFLIVDYTISDRANIVS